MIVLNANQIKDWDAFTMKRRQICSLQLMERASLACFNWLENEFNQLTTCSIVCGKGNNGGDGLALARLLSESGVVVDVYVLENGSKGSDDFQSNLQRIHGTSVKLHYVSNESQLPFFSKSTLLIDAILGIGINREPEGLNSKMIQHMNASGCRIVSIDIPSGLFPDKYTSGNSIVKASDTLSFQAFKTSFLFSFSQTYAGKIHLLDIGLDPDFLETIEPLFTPVSSQFLKRFFKPRPPFSNKGNFGHALIIAGKSNMLGASILAAKACLRAGVGKLTVGIFPEHWSVMNNSLPEAMLDEYDHCLEVAHLKKFNAIAIGPGLGTDEPAYQLILKLLNTNDLTLVLDADSLNLIATNTDTLKYNTSCSYVITPHPKEADRLLGVSSNEFERLEKAKNYCKLHHLVMVLKGKFSLVINEKGQCFVNTSGNAGLAKGGSGDVLTGIVAAFLAQGYSPTDAACLAVFLHGRSADLCMHFQSHESLLPSDVIENMGRAFQELY